MAQIDHAFDAQTAHRRRVGAGQLLAAVELGVDAVEIGILFDRRCPLVGRGGFGCSAGRHHRGGQQGAKEKDGETHGWFSVLRGGQFKQREQAALKTILKYAKKYATL